MIMKISQNEMEEVMRTQNSQRLRMKKENIAKANTLLLRMLADASRNQVVSTTRTVRVNSYE